MTQESVRKIIARLITDDAFKKGFQVNPQLIIQQSGFDVCEQEIIALSKIKNENFCLNERSNFVTNSLDLETFSKINTWKMIEKNI